MPIAPLSFMRAGLLLVAAALLLVALPATAVAGKPKAAAPGKRATALCAKRVGPNAGGADGRRATRRCVRGLLRSSSRRSNRDTTPPSVSWTTPAAGLTVSGRLEGAACEASAADERGVSSVVMKVDGTTLNTERSAPYNCYFDTTLVSDGEHTLSATAYDAAGNARTASVTVKVANRVAPAPEPAPVPEPAPAPEPTPTPGDTSAPSVSWKVPTAQASLSGRIEGPACEATASDDRGVERVVMKIDGTTLNTEAASPYNCYFDTTTVGDGAHTLSATAYDAAGNSRTASVSVTVANAAPAPDPAPAPLPASGLVVGIDGGWGGWSSTETTYRAQLGAAVTRHEWDPLDPVTAQEALVVKAAGQVRTRIHALLGANDLGNATHYREWVVGFIRRYGPGGSFWAEHPELDEAAYAIRTVELGNEPYFGGMSASLYADTVRPTLEAIKAQGLPVKVILPQRVYGTDTSWMDTLYARIPNLNSLFYAFAEHPYWYGHDPAQVHAAGPFGRIDRVRKRMNEKGASDKPIYLTEYGESTASCGSECVSEAVQAENLNAMLNAAITRDYWKIEMVSVFQLLDRGTNSGDRELQFGLLRQNGTQKPSYPLVKSALQKYRG